MAYVDRQSGSKRAASLASAAIIQAAIGAVLVYGLAAKYVIPPEDKPLVVKDFPLPQPSPTEEQTEAAKPDQSVATAPDPKIDIKQQDQPKIPQTPDIPDIPDVIPTASPTGDFRIKDPPKPQLFTPRPPRPANDQSRWVTTDDYPAGDIRREHTGTTRYRVVIGTNGRVTGCEVVKSSGWTGLDEAACNYVSKRAKFEPGTDSSGAKAVGTYTGSVVWRIPK